MTAIAIDAVAANLVITKNASCTTCNYVGDGFTLRIKSFCHGYVTRLHVDGMPHGKAAWIKGDTLEACIANAITYMNAYKNDEDLLMALVSA